MVSIKDDDLEIPQGKRTKLYRFLEILPGFCSYALIALLFILSIISPTLAAIYLLFIIATTLVKAVGVAVRTIQGYNEIQRAMKVDWRDRFLQLNDPHANFEKLREKKSKEFDFDTHVENLRGMIFQIQKRSITQ